MDYWGGDVKRQTSTAYVCLVAAQSVGAGLDCGVTDCGV